MKPELFKGEKDTLPFSNIDYNSLTQQEPLAYRMAPTSLDEYIGQEDLMNKQGPLRKMLESRQMFSLILFGPPGAGKTSFARLVATHMQAKFFTLNALTAGVADIKEVVKEAKNPILSEGKRSILFIDEIHRFNKLQQDALLPYVEEGSIYFIGATTENPYFSVNKALLSRCRVFQLKSLKAEDIKKILLQAWCSQRGLAQKERKIEKEALAFLARKCNGDARYALNILEQAFYFQTPSSTENLTLESISQVMQSRLNHFDKNGEQHYDTISALIKSMRGSDPQASIYYLARALKGGEDPVFLARRLVIAASEEVGLANPQALLICTAVQQAVEKIGMPEARILLSQAVLTVALSPKSNSAYLAIHEALSWLEKDEYREIPYALRNAPHQGMKDLGYSVDYQYPHDFPNDYVKQTYLPKGLEKQVFYQAKDNMLERKMQDYWRTIQKEEGSKRKGQI